MQPNALPYDALVPLPDMQCTLLIKKPTRRPMKILTPALGHHKMQPNALPDMQCTLLIKKPTRRPMKILTPSLQKSTALLTSLEERTLLLVVANP